MDVNVLREPMDHPEAFGQRGASLELERKALGL